MGIFEPRHAQALSAAFDAGVDPQRAIAGLRWDMLNPWGRVLEKFSSHPLVARRIAALDASGLPGRPETWTVLGNAAITDADPAEVARVRQQFWPELGFAVVPWVLLLGVTVGAMTVSSLAGGLGLTCAGLLFVVKQSLRYPRNPQPVAEVASLLERLDAGPVAGIPVQLTGSIIGRGSPGYVLSPDLVLQDRSGFIPLLYRQPIPFAREWFGLFQTKKWLGQPGVTAEGWYRRMPGPIVELRSVHGPGGQHARTWEWAMRKTAAWLVVAAGVITMLISMTTG